MVVPSLLRSFLVAVILAGALPQPGRAAADAPPAAASAVPEASRLEALLRGEGGLRLAGRAVDRAQLLAVYERRGFRAIWDAGRRASLARALADAESHGLDAAAFAVPDGGPAERELLLTDAFLRYATALGRGEVAPTEIETDWAMPAPSFDPAKVLDQALAGDVATVLAGLAPADPGYERLRAALERYRGYAAAESWHRLSITLPLKRGDRGERVRLLRQRLAAEGYAVATEGEEFDAALEGVVGRFQARHGLTADGEVGHATLAALNVSPAARVRQIRLNLERWRSLPHRWPATRIEVNAPAGSAVLFETGEPPLGMRAIVGAADHPTPVMRARMTAVLFNPPWNVPFSIVENEIRPRLKHDPDYLARNDYAYVERNGGRQLQQLPGPENALGQIKFEMPNALDIYLHDTPARSLFRKARRTFSHGCVRLEAPRDLARHLLAASPGWSIEAIDQAIAAGATQRVALPHPVPVYILYWTAFVDPDGTMEFRDDVYGRDRRLAARDTADHLASLGRVTARSGADGD